jgi:hypothetical protein
MAVRRFELDRYLRASKTLDLTGIDFDSVPKHPLSQAEVRCLISMMDIEQHTVIYLRDLLSTGGMSLMRRARSRALQRSGVTQRGGRVQIAAFFA